MEEEHQKRVGRMISGAEDSADFLHRIKKSAAWSGCEEKSKDLGETLIMRLRGAIRRGRVVEEWRVEKLQRGCRR